MRARSRGERRPRGFAKIGENFGRREVASRGDEGFIHLTQGVPHVAGPRTSDVRHRYARQKEFSASEVVDDVANAPAGTRGQRVEITFATTCAAYALVWDHVSSSASTIQS